MLDRVTTYVVLSGSLKKLNASNYNGGYDQTTTSTTIGA
jgi:hypothetical protein